MIGRVSTHCWPRPATFCRIRRAHPPQCYDGPRDGIEYHACDGGGGQSKVVPEAGHLHHYELVTVRDEQIDRVLPGRRGDGCP